MSLKIKEAILRARKMLCLEAVVRYGSISKAAEKNNMKQSNLSVQIKQLEEELGEPIVTRVYNGIKLTEAGRSLYSQSCDLLNVINKIHDVNLKTFRLEGTIRLWTSDGLGIGYIAECFQDFYAAYPKVKIDISCSLDMPKSDQFDLAVVYKEPTDKFLKIADKYNLEFNLYASKNYLAHFGYPKNLTDVMQNHRLCTRENYAGVWSKWADILAKTQNVAAVTNSSAMLLELVKDGIGIGLLPKATAEKEDCLVCLSKIKLNLHHEFWLVVRREVKDVDKVKALLDFIKNASRRL